MVRSNHGPVWVLFLILCVFSLCWGCGSSDDENVSQEGDQDATEEESAADSEPAIVKTTDYVIVAEDRFAEVAAEYAQYRETKGYITKTYTLTELLDGGSAESFKDRLHEELQAIRDELDESFTLFVLLMGDDYDEDEDKTGKIPTLECENSFGDCYTDNLFADLDGDVLPDLALGRLPARDAQQIRDYLTKIKGFEESYTPGLWNRRISIYTGEAGFGETVDGLIEFVVFEALRKMDHSFDVIGAYNTISSPYYYEPFDEKVYELFNGGSLMTVYIGHGSSGGTDGLSVSKLDNIHCNNRLPFTFFFACLNGNFRGPDDSIAEAMIWKDDGPVITVASTDISHPYGNAVLPYELQLAILENRMETIGEAVMETKRQSMLNNDDFRQMVDSSTLSLAEFENAEEQVEIREQHMNLYNLLGDPATALSYPQTAIEFTSVSGSMEEAVLHVQGKAPGVDQGSAAVTLEVDRNVIYREDEMVEIDPDNYETYEVQFNYARAMNKVIVQQDVSVSGGQFSASLTLPEGFDMSLGMDNKYFIKVYAYDDTHDSFGNTRAPNHPEE